VAQQAQIDALQAELVSLKAQVNQLAVDNGKLKADVYASLNVATANVSALLQSIKALEAKPAGIPDLDKYVKIETGSLNGVIGPHILITGANVHVRSGSGLEVAPFV
jgi:vacuolar-type H+-ATPase subunit D/Vma8